MFLKEYRYVLDGEERIMYAVVTYGGAKSNVNIVNVFLSQEMVDNAKQFNRIEFGYEKVEEKNGGYYINALYENGKGTGDHLDEFMNHYASALHADEVKEVVCSCCDKKEFDVNFDDGLAWCKSSLTHQPLKAVKLR